MSALLLLLLLSLCGRHGAVLVSILGSSKAERQPRHPKPHYSFVVAYHDEFGSSGECERLDAPDCRGNLIHTVELQVGQVIHGKQRQLPVRLSGILYRHSQKNKRTASKNKRMKFNQRTCTGPSKVAECIPRKCGPRQFMHALISCLPVTSLAISKGISPAFEPTRPLPFENWHPQGHQ